MPSHPASMPPTHWSTVSRRKAAEVVCRSAGVACACFDHHRPRALSTGQPMSSASHPRTPAHCSGGVPAIEIVSHHSALQHQVAPHQNHRPHTQIYTPTTSRLTRHSLGHLNTHSPHCAAEPPLLHHIVLYFSPPYQTFFVLESELLHCRAVDTALPRCHRPAYIFPPPLLSACATAAHRRPNSSLPSTLATLNNSTSTVEPQLPHRTSVTTAAGRRRPLSQHPHATPPRTRSLSS